MAEQDARESADPERLRQGLKFRRRDDYAVELFKEAQANLGDVVRIDRILVELGRFYNPYIDAPIVDVASRREVMEALARGDPATARRVLAERLELYASPANHPAPGAPSAD